jgi:hypothetical protein
MRPSQITLIALLGTVALASTRADVDEPKVRDEPRNKLVGTWKLVSAKYNGQEVLFPVGSTHIKHVTPTQFMWATYDKDGVVQRTAGGSYTLEKDTYTETPEYGMSSDFDVIKGNAQSFTCKVEGNKWHHDGKLSNGLMIEEVWERMDKK